jgi:drug/metabolite transporter (DMT)-like permease
MKASRFDWLLLACLSLIWGTSFQFTKLAVSTMSPEAIVTIRLVVAALILVPLVYYRGYRLPGWDRRWLSFVAMALLGNALPFYLITWGQERVDSGVAGILMATMPLTTIVLAHFFVEGERLTRDRVFGFGLGFAGVCLLVGPEFLLQLGGGTSLLGRQLALTGGAIAYAVNTVLARRLPDTPSLVTAAAVMLTAAAVMVVLTGDEFLSAFYVATATSAVSAVWLGVISTAVAMLIYYRLIASAGASFVSMINYFIPVVAFLGGVFALGEHVSPRAVLALLVILGGVLIARRRDLAQAG